MNRLSLETSPYLKQHETNPVEWYAWGEEALEKAKRENKPILLSVGYSACHWCHVMAHESFENPEIAALMNAHFVNIKVDREERPDLDQIYQNVAQAITHGGGWPLTVFLLPDQRPFFGGTYFPPEDRYGRPGFPRLLRSLAEAYRVDQASVTENAEKLTQIIAQLESNERGPAIEIPATIPGMEMLKGISEEILSTVDWQEGGFGSAPKFPNTMMLSYLWRMGGESAEAAVVLSLSKMAKGGIFDQLGGGFSRYSVDDHWAVPHFEKMLYDNGLLLQLYSEVLTRDHFETHQKRKSILRPEVRALFIETVTKTVEYLLREMEDPGGGFYAAQDADSEGEEGKFFVWDPKELAEILTPDELQAFTSRYGVTTEGNFEHGKTVLFQATDVKDVVTKELIESASQKVLSERGKRIRPGLDDKILISWNGLAISGLVWAAHALELAEESPELVGRARASATRAFERCAISKLPATIQKGIAKGSGFLDDYAFLARAALDLYRFGEKPAGIHAYEQWAARWMKHVVDFFSDPSGDPGYFFTGSDHEKLLQRPKSLYDQAIPSGTAVACSNLLILSEILETTGSHAAEAEASLKKLAPHLERNSFGHGELASALLLSARGIRVFTGDGAKEAISGDQDFAPHMAPGSGPISEFKVCTRGVCQVFKTLTQWVHSQ